MIASGPSDAYCQAAHSVQLQQQHAALQAQQVAQLQAAVHGYDDADSDDEAQRIGGKPPPVFNEYIESDVERAKFFASRVKTIRAKAETFAKCTGEDVLVVCIDENGNAHHWGTKAFQKFMSDDKVQEMIYKHITEPTATTQPVLQDTRVEAEHLRALLRQKITHRCAAVGITGESAATVYNDQSKRPEDWPVTIPFCEPVHLSHEQLVTILKSFHRKENGLPDVVTNVDGKRPLSPSQQDSAAKRQMVDPSMMQGQNPSMVQLLATNPPPQQQNMYSMLNAVKLLQQGAAAPQLGAGRFNQPSEAQQAAAHAAQQQAQQAQAHQQQQAMRQQYAPPPMQANAEMLNPSFLQKLQEERTAQLNQQHPQ